MDLPTAVKLGARVLAPDSDPLGADQLEVALLDRNRPRRTFRRLRNSELDELLGAT
jgi:proteasome alpha subunit